MKIAVYPGSFDPITLGHIDIIKRISDHFDQLIILVSESNQKSSLFTAEERASFIRENFKQEPHIQVAAHSGLTVDYAHQIKAQVIVRGLRAIGDFEYEMSMAHMNKKLNPSIETMIVFANPTYQYISSRGVKEVAKHQGSLEGLVPVNVAKALKEKIEKMKETR